MISGRSHDARQQRADPTPFSSKAEDLGALRDAVVDGASVGGGLWLSYLFVLFYFAIAAGAVTHRDLLLESPVKLPFLGVELPLKAFFILGPLVFLVVHAYVLLHFVLLAGKVGAFHDELQKQVSGDDKRARLRRQLPSNIFVQFIAGPREVRTGIVGFLLRQVAQISLVAGPIALLLLFQLQFLPYHSSWITWWQRTAVVLDLLLLWLLWPPIARGETRLLAWCDLKRVTVAAWALGSFLPLLLVFTVATFPGEWFEEALPSARIVPTVWPTEAFAREIPENATSADVLLVTAAALKSAGWTSLHQLLVAGEVDYITGRPKSLWSNVVVLPNFEVGDRVKLDTEGKIAISPDTVSLRGRSLEGVVLVNANLRRADLTGAKLAGADLRHADLRGAKFECDSIEEWPCPQIVRDGAELPGARLDGAKLQGVLLDGLQLQGASLKRNF